ncbi:hypothetical protein [Pseudomonas umsongensis]|uniref:hypothetical protein n=1 Tax=Pseudomonas umsongensis TaxID=198618 RepID=UPI003D7F64FC
MSGDLPVLSGFPTVRGFFIRLSEKDFDSPLNIGVKETGRQVDASVKNHLQGVHMSLTVGLPHSAVVNIGGKSAAAVDTLSDTASVQQSGEPVMALQSQIADTLSALIQVAASLAKELTGSGSIVSTTA